MKKNNTNAIVSTIATIATAGTAIAATRLVYTPKKAEAKARKVWERERDNIVRDLKLPTAPTLVFENNKEASGVMYVNTRIEYETSLFTRTITKQSTDGIVHVNSVAVAENINNLHAVLCRNIAEEFILALLRHECRHIYQCEADFNVGKVENVFSLNMDIFEGHGATPEEIDANIYAICAAENKKQRLVAKLNKAIQDEACKLCADTSEIRRYTKELRNLSFFNHER